jgi:alcohol dehydrogenase class IV
LIVARSATAATGVEARAHCAEAFTNATWHALCMALVFPNVLAFNAPACLEKTAETPSCLGLSASSDRDEVRQATRGRCQSRGIEMSLKVAVVATNDLRPWAQEAHGIRRLSDDTPP